MTAKRTHPGWWMVVFSAALLGVLTGCATAGGEPGQTSAGDGPGGSGIVSAAPDAVDAVDEGTACGLIAQSETLVSLGMTGVSYDPTLADELSGCQLTIAAPPHEYSSFGLAVVDAAYLDQIGAVDPAVSGTTLAELPDLGDGGWFLALQPGVDPATDPKAGVIVAAKGGLGVSLSWAMMESSIPFATFEQAVRETVAALP